MRHRVSRLAVGSLYALLACAPESNTHRAQRYRAEMREGCRNYDRAKATGDWNRMIVGDQTYCAYVRERYATFLRDSARHDAAGVPSPRGQR